VALVYPGTKELISRGDYLDPKTSIKIDKECCVIFHQLKLECGKKKYPSVYSNTSIVQQLLHRINR
jgi:hypothetical protein